MKSNIVIIGGGIIGSAAAYFLARCGNAGSITVIEPDSTYTKATTPQGAGGVRQQFSVAENIEMSRFSLAFYKNFAKHMADIPDIADIQFREQGYLLLVSKNGESSLRINQQLQSSLGVNAELIDYQQIKQRFPSISRDDIALGCHTPDDGWIDPTAGLWGFRKAASHLGANYVNAAVTDMQTSATKIASVKLNTGENVEADFFINTAGAWVADIAKMSGASLPVVPMCRVQHFWNCAEPIEPLPLIKDESGMFFRPEGTGFAGGRPSFDIQPGFIDDIYSGFFANYFEDTVWPLIAGLVPKFENLRLQRSWAGHYAQNLFDANMIIGPYSPGHDNIITACGFSGHGIMHAPAVGRALCERALSGRYQSIDLTRLEIDRIKRNEPCEELGIK